MSILDDIFEVKRAAVEKAKRAIDPQAMADKSAEVRAVAKPHRFRNSIARQKPFGIIAEFKRASPSKGIINDRLDPARTALMYESGGACAISVLTEEDFFKGSIEDLKTIRDAVSLPLLRKDFIFDEFQIHEAAAAGADAVLLIVAALDLKRLADLYTLAERGLGLDVLVEVHTLKEMQIAKEIGARLIGVNNRDLRSFEVSLDVSRDLVTYAADDAVLVSESGFSMRDQLVELSGLGYHAFLIGETLMRSDDPEGGLRKLVGPSTATTVL